MKLKVNLNFLLNIFTYLLFFYFCTNPVFAKLTFSRVIQEVAPAVVSIYGNNITTKNNIKENIGNLCEQIWGKECSTQSNALGSGVIISEDGLIVTSAHVVDQKNNITITLNNGKEYKAQKLDVNNKIDLALLRIISANKDTKEKFHYLDLADEKDNTNIGDVVLAIGNPFGMGQTVTLGIVSGIRYFEKGEDVGFGKLIQIDASINPGNSGGALINSDGFLIGINSNIYSYKNNINNGIGFAIPVSVVKLFVKRYFEGNSLKKYWIGLTGITVTNSIATKMNLSYPHGVLVNNVTKDAPADKANIKSGDIIVKMGNMYINAISDLSFAVAKIDSTDLITITLIRNNKEISVILAPEIPSENPKKDLYTVTEGVLKGTVFANNSPLVSYEVNSDLNQTGVVIYRLSFNSLLKRLGLAEGDIVMKVGDKDIYTTEDIKNCIRGNTNNYKLVLKRNNQIINLNINR